MSEQIHSLPEQTMEIPISELEEAQKQIRSRKRMKVKIAVAGSVLIVVAGAVLFQVIQSQSGAASPDPDSELRNAAPGNDQSLAKVGQTLIRWQDVANECMERHGREVLDNIINRTIIQQSCDQNGISISKVEIDGEIFRIAKRFNLDTQNWYSVIRDERGMSKIQYQRDVIWPMLALKKIAGKQIQKPTETEIQKAFIREYGIRIEARMIMLDNLRRANQVHQMVKKNPQDFGRIAQKYSVEPTSKAMGGVIPPIRRFGGNKTIEEAAFKLRQGEISPVIVLGSRYVILICDGRTKPVVTNIADVQDQLYDMVNERKMQEGVAKVFAELKETAEIHNYLTNSSYGIRNAKRKNSKFSNGVQQTSGTKSANRGSYPESPSQRK